MHDLAKGIARFQREVFPAKQELFAHLAAHHAPARCSSAAPTPASSPS